MDAPALRPLTPADIPAWNRLLAAVEAADRTGEHYNEADLAEEMANPDIEVGKDVVGAFAGEELVGFFAVYPRSGVEDVHKIGLDGAVHPDFRGRGVGAVLAAAMHERAQVVAYLQTNEYDAYFASTGRREAYVGKVGTRREHRGRGLAGALLGHALLAYQAAGYDESSLDVDSENPTGALGIYRRAGFEVDSRWTDYAERVLAGAVRA